MTTESEQRNKAGASGSESPVLTAGMAGVLAKMKAGDFVGMPHYQAALRAIASGEHVVVKAAGEAQAERIRVALTGLRWGDHQRDGQLHTEWFAPCGCAYHSEPFPHVHPCSEAHKRPDLHAAPPAQEADAEDAARYRWLRDNVSLSNSNNYGNATGLNPRDLRRIYRLEWHAAPCDEDLDEIVDAARRSTLPKGDA